MSQNALTVTHMTFVHDEQHLNRRELQFAGHIYFLAFLVHEYAVAGQVFCSHECCWSCMCIVSASFIRHRVFCCDPVFWFFLQVRSSCPAYVLPPSGPGLEFHVLLWIALPSMIVNVANFVSRSINNQSTIERSHRNNKPPRPTPINAHIHSRRGRHVNAGKDCANRSLYDA